MPYSYEFARYIPEYPGDVDPLLRTVVTPEMREAAQRGYYDKLNALIAERQKHDAEVLEQREREQQEQAQRDLESHRESMREQYRKIGASDADFDKAWEEELKPRHLRELAANNLVEQNRAAMRSRYERVS